MELKIQYMTENDCYKQNRTYGMQGIMVHSTATPGVMAEAWYSRWNKPGVEKCVHAFVDDRVVVQYLPWTMRGWHAGQHPDTGKSANNTHIGFEICEPKDWESNAVYFEQAWDNAVELCVALCRQFGLTAADITSHCEGYRAGIASNHGDPMHWFPKFGKSMDGFRQEVHRRLKGEMVVMGKVVNADKLIAWIDGNAVEMDEGGGNAASRYRTTANLYYHTTYPAKAGDASTRAGKWPKGTVVDVVDGWESAGGGYTWVKVMYSGGSYYAAKEYLERV